MSGPNPPQPASCRPPGMPHACYTHMRLIAHTFATHKRLLPYAALPITGISTPTSV